MTTVVEPTRGPLRVPPRKSHNPWLVLLALGLAQLMLVLDITVVNIALPRAQRALGFSDADRQWVVTAYSLAFGSLLLVGGRLADILGRRRIFVIGLVGFAVASAVGGMSTSFAMLVGARAAQGAFGAMLAPAALATIAATFTDPAQRAKAFGAFGAISALGGSIGLILGGTLTEYLNWRWVMYVNVVIAAVALLGGSTLMPAESRRPSRQPVDWPGALLASAGVFAIVYGFSRAGNGNGVSDLLAPVTTASVAAGLALLVGFVLRQRRTTHPMLPLHILRDTDRRGAYAATFMAAVGVFGVMLFLTYYLQGSLGYSPVRTGLAFLPMALMVIVVGGVVQAALAGRVSYRAMLPVGLLAVGVGMALLSRVGAEPHYASVVLPGVLVMGVGLGLVFAPSFNMGTDGVADSEAGVASAMVHVAQQIGGSIGTALLNSVATSVATSYVAARIGRGPVGVVPAGVVQAGVVPAGVVQAGVVQARAAIHSYSVVFWISAVSFAVAAVIVTALLHPGALRSRRTRLVVSPAALAPASDPRRSQVAGPSRTSLTRAGPHLGCGVSRSLAVCETD